VYALPDEAFKLFKKSVGDDAAAKFASEGVTVAIAESIIHIFKQNALKIKDDGDDDGVVTAAVKRRRRGAEPIVATVGWVSGSSEYARPGSALSNG
jgi:hypothetical protein